MSSHLSPYLLVKERTYTLLLGRFTSAILTNRSFLVECTERTPYGVIKGLAYPSLGPDLARSLISHLMPLMPLVAHSPCTSSFPLSVTRPSRLTWDPNLALVLTRQFSLDVVPPPVTFDECTYNCCWKQECAKRYSLASVQLHGIHT